MQPTSRQAAEAIGINKSVRRNVGDQVIRLVLFLAASVSVVTTVAVIYSLSAETISFFLDPAVSLWEFLTDRRWTPLFGESQRHFGISPLIIGTLNVTFVALLVGIPLGLGSAIFLSEFATARTRRTVMPMLEILAGIPTVVLGYFALFFVTPILRDIIPGLNLFNPISAGLVMGFMILPTISSISVDSMQAVPRSIREAAYGLGASRVEVVLKVVVPAAL